MDDETPEMEAITNQMREVMRAWIDDPDNERLKAHYRELQAAYERAFLKVKQLGGERSGSQEATHQAYS